MSSSDMNVNESTPLLPPGETSTNYVGINTPKTQPSTMPSGQAKTSEGLVIKFEKTSRGEKLSIGNLKFTTDGAGLYSTKKGSWWNLPISSCPLSPEQRTAYKKFIDAGPEKIAELLGKKKQEDITPKAIIDMAVDYSRVPVKELTLGNNNWKLFEKETNEFTLKIIDNNKKEQEITLTKDQAHIFKNLTDKDIEYIKMRNPQTPDKIVDTLQTIVILQSVRYLIYNTPGIEKKELEQIKISVSVKGNKPTIELSGKLKDKSSVENVLERVQLGNGNAKIVNHMEPK